MFHNVFHFTWSEICSSWIPPASRYLFHCIHSNSQWLDSLIREDALLKLNRDLSCYSMLNPYC